MRTYSSLMLSILLEYFVVVAGNYISFMNLSFFQSMSCPDGMIGLGSSCECFNGSACRLATLRSFLPPNNVFSDFNIKYRPHDAQFSKHYTEFILRNSRKEIHRGYPLGRDCRKVDPENWCAGSFGKVLRYNGLVEYGRFGLGTFRSDYGKGK